MISFTSFCATILVAAIVFAAERSPLPANRGSDATKVLHLTGDFTITWWQHVDQIETPQTILELGSVSARIKPLPKAKQKDAPRAVFTIGELQSKTMAYPGKWYQLAIVRKAGEAKLFINGEPDGATGRMDDITGSVDGVKTALSDDQIRKQFAAGLPARDITVAGHRGINRFAPENTRVSYMMAIHGAVPIVEMDLRLTKDNVLVLMHDPTVDRTTTGKGKVVEMTVDEIRKLDAGSWKDKTLYAGEKVPLVEEICATCRGKAVMMLDLKCTGLGKSLAELKQKLNYPTAGWILAPWEDEEGIELRKYLPDVTMIRLTSKVADVFDDAYFAKMKQIGFSGFSVNWANLPQAFIDGAHKNGMKVWAWTINDGPEIGGAVLAGVDGIVTDDGVATMKTVDGLTRKQ